MDGAPSLGSFRMPERFDSEGEDWSRPRIGSAKFIIIREAFPA